MSGPSHTVEPVPQRAAARLADKVRRLAATSARNRRVPLSLTAAIEVGLSQDRTAGSGQRSV